MLYNFFHSLFNKEQFLLIQKMICSFLQLSRQVRQHRLFFLLHLLRKKSLKRQLERDFHLISLIILLRLKVATLKPMQENYIKYMPTEHVPYRPISAYDSTRKVFVHLYENTEIDPATFKEEVKLYQERKQSFSGAVVTVSKIKDEHIEIREGNPTMQVTIVTDYVPWRYHLCKQILTYEEGLFLLDGAVKGFRELLHRIKTPFIVQKFMIGVNAKGEVKVWWNEHFHKNRFSFLLTSNVKLRDMVKSLVTQVAEGMNPKDKNILESNIFIGGDINFVNLQSSIKELAKGLNLCVIGHNMMSQIPEVAFVTKKYRQNAHHPPPLVFNQSRRISRVLSNQKAVMLVPDSPTQRKVDRSSDKLITKRTYKNGTSPELVQKMNIIKEDILKLREVANEKDINKEASTLRHSKSLSSFTSYNRGVHGNTAIPEVSRLISESRVEGDFEKPTVSMFIQPKQASFSQSAANQANPEHGNVGGGMSSLRKAQSSHIQNPTGLKLSRIRSLQNLDTERLNEFDSMTPKKNSMFGSKFAQTEKKLQSNSTNFASLIV